MECQATGEAGHGKPIAQAQEVLGYVLAREAGVAVPETELGTLDGSSTIAVSKWWGQQSSDVKKAREVTPDIDNSAEFKKGLREASGLLAYHAWLGTSDLKDEHLVVRPGANPGEYEIAGVDFAQGALDWPAGGDGGTVTAPADPPALLNNRDAQVIRSTVERIEAISPQRIEAIVGSLPDNVLAAPEKDRISKGLVARKSKLRGVLSAAGWI